MVKIQCLFGVLSSAIPIISREESDCEYVDFSVKVSREMEQQLDRGYFRVKRDLADAKNIESGKSDDGASKDCWCI